MKPTTWWERDGWILGFIRLPDLWFSVVGFRPLADGWPDIRPSANLQKVVSPAHPWVGGPDDLGDDDSDDVADERLVMMTLASALPAASYRLGVPL